MEVDCWSNSLFTRDLSSVFSVWPPYSAAFTALLAESRRAVDAPVFYKISETVENGDVVFLALFRGELLLHIHDRGDLAVFAFRHLLEPHITHAPEPDEDDARDHLFQLGFAVNAVVWQRASLGLCGY